MSQDHLTSLHIQHIVGRANRYNSWIFRTIQPYLGRRILDVGCSIGNITQFYSDRERVVGLDLSPVAIDEAVRRFADRRGFEGYVGDISDASVVERVGPSSFDTVVCLNVIEHIEDDVRALRHMRRVLGDDGRVVLLTPAHPVLYGSMDAADHHFRRYVSPELASKVESAGFRVEVLRPFNLVGFFGWFVNGRILRKRLIPEDQLGWFDRIVPILERVERFNRIPFGQSLFCVGRALPRLV